MNFNFKIFFIRLIVVSLCNNLKSKSNSINNCLKGTTNTADGFKWKYKNNN